MSSIACTLLMVLLVACSSHDEDLATRDAIAALADRTTAFQAELLEDGILTVNEYERAVLAAKACIEDLGFEVSEVERINPDGTLGFVYGGVSEESGLDLADACFDEYLTDVAEAWSLTVAPSESEVLERLKALSACLEAAGHEDVPVPSRMEEVAQLTERYQSDGARCAEEAGLVYVAVYGENEGD